MEVILMVDVYWDNIFVFYIVYDLYCKWIFKKFLKLYYLLMNFLYKKRERLGEREFRRVYLKDKLKIVLYLYICRFR